MSYIIRTVIYMILISTSLYLMESGKMSRKAISGVLAMGIAIVLVSKIKGID